MLQKTQRFIPGLSQLAVYCCKKKKNHRMGLKDLFQTKNPCEVLQMCTCILINQVFR